MPGEGYGEATPTTTTEPDVFPGPGLLAGKRSTPDVGEPVEAGFRARDRKRLESGQKLRKEQGLTRLSSAGTKSAIADFDQKGPSSHEGLELDVFRA